MKIYTKTGDQGKTGLFGGTRVPKDHIRIEAYGTLDELNSHLGLIRDQKLDGKSTATLLKIQEKLFVLGAILATEPAKATLKNGRERLNIEKISEGDITLLEEDMDAMEELLPPMTHFILPGGHPTVSFCHIARCVCRRAERLAIRVHAFEPLEPNALKYINRLSDYLFVLARKLSFDLNADEIKWIPEKKQ